MGYYDDAEEIARANYELTTVLIENMEAFLKHFRPLSDDHMETQMCSVLEYLKGIPLTDPLAKVEKPQ